MFVMEVLGGFIRIDLDEEIKNFEKFIDGSFWLFKGAGGEVYEFCGKLSWNLFQLVFNFEELDVVSLVGLMEGILKEFMCLYFMCRCFQVDMILLLSIDWVSFLSKQLCLEELIGFIDVMMGGWFQCELVQQIWWTMCCGKVQFKRSNKKSVAKLVRKQGSFFSMSFFVSCVVYDLDGILVDMVVNIMVVVNCECKKRFLLLMLVVQVSFCIGGGFCVLIERVLFGQMFEGVEMNWVVFDIIGDFEVVY